MLVLSRKPGEKIRIGDTITISVVRIHGSRVQLGVDAPRDVGVRRQELDVDILETSTGGACRSSLRR